MPYHENDREGLIPKEKSKNEDQEWWKHYFHSGHQRSESQASTATTASTASTCSTPESSPSKRSRTTTHGQALSLFPSPPRSTPKSPMKKRKSRPPCPIKGLGEKMEGQCETEKRSFRVKPICRTGAVDLDKPLPPTPLISFRDIWPKQESWVDEKWPGNDGKPGGWL